MRWLLAGLALLGLLAHRTAPASGSAGTFNRARSPAVFAEYDYLEGTVLLRSSHRLKRAQATRYAEAVRHLVYARRTLSQWPAKGTGSCENTRGLSKSNQSSMPSTR
jgi:hypothetical protein